MVLTKGALGKHEPLCKARHKRLQTAEAKNATQGAAIVKFEEDVAALQAELATTKTQLEASMQREAEREADLESVETFIANIMEKRATSAGALVLVAKDANPTDAGLNGADHMETDD